jgi:hypothetical protein
MSGNEYAMYNSFQPENEELSLENWRKFEISSFIGKKLEVLNACVPQNAKNNPQNSGRQKTLLTNLPV